MPEFVTNDGVTLQYIARGDPKSPPLVMLHGFTGSGDVFQRNYNELQNKHLVVVPDLRGHGLAARNNPPTGYHVSRLAIDLKNLIDHCSRDSETDWSPGRVSAIGTSLGAAILWSYAELFGTSLFSHLIFVDQAPLQNYLSDWGPEFGNRGMNNPAALAGLQQTLERNPDEAYLGTIHGCLGYRYEPRPGDPTADDCIWREDEGFFLQRARSGNPWWYGKLMADHTAIDWRDSIAHNFGPDSQGGNNCTKVLVVASSRSGCFPAAGPLKVVELVNGGPEKAGRAKGVTVDWGGHWCYWEDPEKFNKMCLDFLEE